MPPKVADEVASVCHIAAVSELLDALRSGGVVAPSGSKVPGSIKADATRLNAALAALDVQDAKVRIISRHWRSDLSMTTHCTTSCPVQLIAQSSVAVVSRHAYHRWPCGSSGDSDDWPATCCVSLIALA